MEKWCAVKVAVVGAGIGGLAVAAGLRRAGADVTVLERAPGPATSGVALTLFGNGIAALDRLGLGGPVRDLAGPAPHGTPAGLRDPRGRWLSRMGPAVVGSGRAVRRADLHELLAAPVADAVRYGVRATGARRGEVDVAGRTLGGFDLVVAADGLRSVVRRGWSDDPGVVFAGYHAWRGLSAGVGPLDGVGESWGRGRRFGIVPLADGSVYWFATLSGPRRPAPRADLAEVRDTFAGWHRDVEAVLGCALADVSCLPIEELTSPPARFARDGVALLGDAAHAMTPNLGQGANQALEDAARLVALLAPLAGTRPTRADVDAALDRYTSQRRPRVRRIAVQARRIGAVGQWQHPWAVATRDAALRAVPDRVSDAAAVAVQRPLPRPRTPPAMLPR